MYEVERKSNSKTLSVLNRDSSCFNKYTSLPAAEIHYDANFWPLHPIFFSPRIRTFFSRATENSLLQCT